MPKGSFKLELPLPRVRGRVERGLIQLADLVRSSPWQQRIEQISARVLELRAGVQRFREQTWQRIAARWPVVAELLRERKNGHFNYRPAAPADVVSPLLSREAIHELLQQLDASPNWQVRRSAASSLGHVEAEGVVPALVRALRDTSVEVAVAAVEGLASHHEPDSTRALLGVLENADGYFSPLTRVAAISGLTLRLRADELAPLFTAMRAVDAEVSIAAIAMLSERAPSLAREHLLPILRDRSGYFLPVVRLAAANALERSGGLSESLALELAQTEPDPAVRRALERARYALGRESAVT